jgi:hypothetical protein
MSHGDKERMQEQNFCLYFGTAAERIAQGWRPGAVCSGTPGSAEDHAHISGATFERMSAKNQLVLVDADQRIVTRSPENAA